jgi:hypothetical protein
MSCPKTKEAPIRVNKRPIQNFTPKRSLNNIIDPSPTHNGAVFAIKVGLVAPLNTIPVAQKDKSAAKNMPPSTAKPISIRGRDDFSLLTLLLNGNAIIRAAIAMR